MSKKEQSQINSDRCFDPFFGVEIPEMVLVKKDSFCWFTEVNNVHTTDLGYILCVFLPAFALRHRDSHKITLYDWNFRSTKANSE